MAGVDTFLKKCRDVQASDLHLTVGLPPTVRHNGRLKRVKYHALTSEELETFAREILTAEQWGLFEKRKEIDLAYVSEAGGRCRTCVCRHHGGIDIVFRLIPDRIPRLDELHLPPVVEKLLDFRQGMILVTGQAGCGKSTTLAAMVDYLNEKRHEHIICLEDPIEFIHHSNKCHILQREVGHHTASFARALRACLREDPDVIIVGEMRDLDTISMAITAAETGHLVLATLHTTSAPRTIMRVMDVFPPNQQDQIRTMLSESLRGIISQQLIPTADELGRTVAVEVLVCTPAIANLIREDRTFQIPSHMQVGSKLGMRLMDDALLELLQRNQITAEVAVENAHDPNKFRNLEHIRKEQVNWDKFILMSEKEKKKTLIKMGVILIDRKTRRAKPFNRDSIPFRFYQTSHGKLPEDIIYAEVCRIFPEAAAAPVEKAGAGS